MNHYDLLIKDYLLQHKSISFEKIGTLVFNEAAASSVPESSSNSIVFHFDKKAITTPGLIDYVAERAGKSKVLIQSDLDSHFELIRQFINIGKSYELEGIGAISLSKSGEYVFVPHQLLPGKEEYKTTKKKEHFTPSPTQTSRSSNRGLLMVVAILIIAGVLGVIGWGAYNFFVAKNTGVVTDSLAASSALSDTTTQIRDTAQMKDTAQTALADSSAIKTDTANYKFIYSRTFSLEQAINRTDEQRVLGYKAGYDSIKTDSATLYRLYVRMWLSSADTLMMKDSLQRFLQHAVKIVRVN